MYKENQLRMLRMKQLIEYTSMSKSHLYQKIAGGILAFIATRTVEV